MKLIQSWGKNDWKEKERKKVCFKRSRIGKGMVKPKTKYLFGEPGENTWGERLPEISAIA